MSKLMFHGGDAVAKLCATCTKNIASNEPYIGCNNCFMWFHVACLGKSSKSSMAKLAKLSQWFCSEKCSENHQRNAEPKSVVKGSKLAIPENPTIKDLCQLLIQHMDASRADIDRVTRIIVDNEKKHTNEVRYLRSEINQLKQQQIENNVIISGFPLKLLKPSDVVTKILEVLGAPEMFSFSAQVLSEQRQKKQQQQHQHRKQQQQRKHQEAVLIRVHFERRSMKTDFMAAIKQHGPFFANEINGGDSNNQIYIRDELTAYYNKLAYETRILKKDLQFQYCWFKNFRMLIRKTQNSRIYSFRSFEDLEEFKCKMKEIEISLDETTNSVTINLDETSNSVSS